MISKDSQIKIKLLPCLGSVFNKYMLKQLGFLDQQISEIIDSGLIEHLSYVDTKNELNEMNLYRFTNPYISNYIGLSNNHQIPFERKLPLCFNLINEFDALEKKPYLKSIVLQMIGKNTHNFIVK
jgi:hypothetical protein